MHISHYELLEKIAEAPHTAVYKAYHKQNPKRLLTLKILKSSAVSEQRRDHLRQKLEHLKVLNPILATPPLSFGEKDGDYFVTQEYFPGVTLDRLLQERSPLPLSDFLAVACRVTEALHDVHEAGIVHGGVKPHNILVNPRTLDVRLIDFIGALDVRDVSHFIYDRGFVRGTLAYTSPEQTGRISHRVAFSSDIYSLGIVFSEMLCGHPPFLADDPLELIHAHLAKEPPDVHEIAPGVPLALSKIVARLLLKEPEKRYQSARGLLADLVRCRDQYAATGAISEFPLEMHVSAHRVAFVSKMVGRDAEAARVLEEYEQAAHGGFRAMFISGPPGIGKTRLIQELQRPIVQHRGYFTSGKFDIYQKNIPYSSLTQALRNLVRTFLTESNQRTSVWRNKILTAVGENGRVLTDVIPELEVLIGRQPEVAPLPPVESLNRFNDVFDTFLSSLASEENPLTLFIDDLQWCDAASFDFLAYVFANHLRHPWLFLLGAYRHNEVDASHPLAKLIRNAVDDDWPLEEIRLESLGPAHCHAMVSYILDSPLPQTRELSDFIAALTEGNPLFVSESLAFLYNERLLSFAEGGAWRWDFEKIRVSRMPTTVVGLFTAKIGKLPRELVALLEYCACMGNTFSPVELARIRETSLHETFELLKPALEQGLLMENRNQLQFIHDRVQEAALSGMPEQRRRHIHRDIGSHLVAAIPPGAEIETLDNLFIIVAHLNLAQEECPDAAQAYFLSDMNYHAGNKALDSLATEAANTYFNLSLRVLPPDCWSDAHYHRTFRIFQKAAKTELMCGNYEDSQRLINTLLEQAKTDLDRVDCLAEQTTSLSSIGNFIEAIGTANRGLAYFGKAIPNDAAAVDKKREALVAEIAATIPDIRAAFVDMPFARDRKSQVEHAFYSELLADLYLSGRVPELYLIAAQAVLHCFSAGMDEAVMYAFTAMAIYHAEHEQFERSFVYEDLTYDLAAKYPNTFAATKCMTGAVFTLMHSRSHPRDVAAYSLKAIQCGKSCGDLNNAGYSYGPLMWNLQAQGADLPRIGEYVKECLQFSKRYRLGIATGLATAVQAGWVEPMNRVPAPAAMEELLAQWERDNHIVSLGSYHVLRAQAHYYLAEYGEAERCLARGQRYLSGFSNSLLKRQWHVLKVLNGLRTHDTRLPDRDERLRELRPLVAQIGRWAALGPSLKPYLALVAAEFARATGTFAEARTLYLDAIDAAQAEGYTLLAGHIDELFGEFLLQAGRGAAGTYFAAAARLYQDCGAGGKESALLERHPEQRREHRPPAAASDTATTLPDLDVTYLMKSALVISAELELQALLKKIMNVVLESSGAQHGYLLVADAGNLVILAESHVEGGQAARPPADRLDEAQDICKAIVRYVQRTGEKVILGDACREGIFSDNPEAQHLQLRSVLCLPVVKQAKPIGVLYLENRLAAGVFTPEKTLMTELLTSQAAISFENARLLEREHFLADLLRNASLAIATGYPSGRLGTTNPAFQRLTGYTDDELKTITWNETLTPPEWREHEDRKLEDLHRTARPVRYEKECIRKDGTRIPVELVVHPLFDDAGRVRQYYAFVSDITERKRAADQIKRSLEEKEMLLREIHHRVKNNLQIVHSLLNLQLPHIKDRQAVSLFKESQDRIYSMALIHEKLYRSESLARIDLAEYLRSLVANLLLSHGANARDIRPVIAVDDVALNVDTVIPVALIINELVSNSLKHAFPPASRGPGEPREISVDIRRRPAGDIALRVCDNGVGLAPGFAVQPCESLGLKLVEVLVRQLRGVLHLGSSPGTEFLITFRERAGKGASFDV